MALASFNWLHQLPQKCPFSKKCPKNAPEIWLFWCPFCHKKPAQGGYLLHGYSVPCLLAQLLDKFGNCLPVVAGKIQRFYDHLQFS